MTGLNLSNRIDHIAMAFLITLVVMTPIGAIVGLAHAL
jgi:hypothetical protein